MKLSVKAVLLGSLITCTSITQAAGNVYQLVIKNNVFEPTELVIPAGTKIQLNIKNLDGTPEEFDSSDLSREKVIPAGGEVIINIGPLKAGKYSFSGEYHEDTAIGVIIAK